MILITNNNNFENVPTEQQLKLCSSTSGNWDGSVGIVTAYELDGRGVRIRNFPLSTSSRLVFGPI
jgi:hypothetical protein